jgi:mannose-6-phosphate isomerase-like protein (cupin superfamily)
MHYVINRDDLPRDGRSFDFEGYLHDQVNVSVIFVEMPPGHGPDLHRHPYAEVFIVQEGTVTFTVGDATVDASGGQIVIGPAGVPHKFVNSGTGPLRQIDIHLNDRFITEWLEDRASPPSELSTTPLP